MKMYCEVLPRKRPSLASMSAGVNEMTSPTASHERPARPRAAASGLLMSAATVAAPAIGARSERLSSVTPTPRATASSVHAVLMIPVPPTNRTFMVGAQPRRSGRGVHARKRPHFGPRTLARREGEHRGRGLGDGPHHPAG